MCGRFGLTATPDQLTEHFDLPDPPRWEPHYNIAPGQQILSVIQDPSQLQRQAQSFQWGLIPSWAKDPKPLINARAETLAEKPSFRTALRQRRCLIPADGFYEWQGQGKSKQPFHIGLKEGALFAFAGLWEQWESPEGIFIQTCAIITTAPNELMVPIHNRMPVILDRADYFLWLDPKVQDPTVVVSLLKPYSAAMMMTFPVSQWVNSPKNDDSSCRDPFPNEAWIR